MSQAETATSHSPEEPGRRSVPVTGVSIPRGKSYYTRELFRLFRTHVPEGASVLEIGLRQRGDLLASLKPGRGVGLDADASVIEAARAGHPGLTFIHARAEEADLGGETFDFILLSTGLAQVTDVQAVLERVRRACRPDTRVIVAYHNALWEPILRLATALGLRRQTGAQNWLSMQDLLNLAYLADMEVIRKSGEVLLPMPVPFLAAFLNHFLVRFWPWHHFGLIHLLIAKPRGPVPELQKSAKVSVIIPTRNERGNIEGAVTRTPELGIGGGGTEIIFVDGNSTDGTQEEIQKWIRARPDRDMKLILQGSGKGKGDAVRKGFAAATGDILMILDADLTVAPEVLPRFVDAIVSGKGELINGTRLVYPMDQQAMRFLNKLGNRFFSMLFTWLLNQPIRDTLCGTKVLSRKHYDIIAKNRAYFGDFDPFGDFDLLLGACKANLKICEIPVHYGARTYGTTNISRFRDGALLLKMSWFAFRRLKIR